MAFTGTPVIQEIADNLFRITGVSLAAGATGVIGLEAHASAEVQLPCQWNRYVNAKGVEVELDAAIQVQVIKAEAGLSTTEACAVVKTGDGPTDWIATISNPDAAASGELEIYVRFH